MVSIDYLPLLQKLITFKRLHSIEVLLVLSSIQLLYPYYEQS